ncbi:uncharacterized protein [Aegilops tauschii subsp. strangulata]|uniref:uncharacterized protein n=1 Tax=Aegilops tauschii subsp. strangulata TaxID=200361 RepID=UPI001E22F844
MGTPTATVAALALLLLLCVSMSSLSGCLAAQYKVGGLDAWGIPPSTKPDVYVRWAKSVPVKLGDALFFLYPPSQDSAVQVTAKAFAACDVSDPLLKPSADDSSGSAESARTTSCAGLASSPTGSPFFVAPRLQSKGGELPTAGARVRAPLRPAPLRCRLRADGRRRRCRTATESRRPLLLLLATPMGYRQSAATSTRWPWARARSGAQRVEIFPLPVNFFCWQPPSDERNAS